MDRDFDGTFAHDRHPDPRDRRQPGYRANLTLAIVEPQALWAAAAANLLGAPEMTLGDVIDTIGPREDPSIDACIAMMAKPIAIPGCIMDDFWVDGLRGCPPRIDTADAVIEYRVAPAEIVDRRAKRTALAGRSASKRDPSFR